jgi:trehalose 6-phosphate phosphatase
MRPILRGAGLEVLSHFAWSNVVLSFDFDGTLAPIVAEPHQARMRPQTELLLSQLARLYPVTVISGRARADVLARVKGAGVLDVVGNHGAESKHRSDRFRRRVERWMPLLQAQLSAIEGVRIENKRFSVAIHYRGAAKVERARSKILKVVAALEGARVIGGKRVVNLLPRGAPDKGVALERQRRRFNCAAAIYVGDDENDEDAFALDRAHLLGIRVERKRGTRAHYFLRDQSELDVLLAMLVELRSNARPRVIKAS